MSMADREEALLPAEHVSKKRKLQEIAEEVPLLEDSGKVVEFFAEFKGRWK